MDHKKNQTAAYLVGWLVETTWRSRGTCARTAALALTRPASLAGTPFPAATQSVEAITALVGSNVPVT